MITNAGTGGNKEVSILLGDYHREYTGELDKLEMYDDSGRFGDKGGTFVRCSVIWDTYELAQVFDDIHGVENGEAEIERMTNLIFPPELHEIPHIWLITGHLRGLDRVFDTLANALTVETVSGDDDAFDYWPNTMDMLFDLATDLDRLNDTLAYTDRVTEIAEGVFERTVADAQGSQYDTVEQRRDLFASEWSNLERWKRDA